jgi:hypothetical protein
MKCSNPDCSRGIGLVSHRRGWFDKQCYCSKPCCEAVTAQVRAPRSSPQRRTMSYVDWLLHSRLGGHSRGWASPVSASWPRSGEASSAERSRQADDRLGREYGCPMPPMGGAQLSSSEVSAVAAYIWALNHRGGG